MIHKLLPAVFFEWRRSKKNMVVIDMRSELEYKEGHLPDAIHIKEYLRACSRDGQEIICYWQENETEELSFESYYVLVGGYIAWQRLAEKVTRKCHT